MFLLSTFGGSSNIRDERAISETTFLLHKRPSCEHIPSHNIIWVVCFLLKYVLEPALSDAIKTLHPFSSLIQFWVVAFRLFQPQLEQGATHCGNIFWNGENLEFFYCVLRDQGGWANNPIYVWIRYRCTFSSVDPQYWARIIVFQARKMWMLATLRPANLLSALLVQPQFLFARITTLSTIEVSNQPVFSLCPQYFVG